MNHDDDPASETVEVIESARAAADAMQDLCRATVSRPSMTPADVADVLSELATAAARLPQAARQLSDIIEHANTDQGLRMDTLTDVEDPEEAVAATRRHLAEVEEPAHGLYRLLDAAHNQTAHIATSVAAESTTGLAEKLTMASLQDTSSLTLGSEDREPPPTGHEPTDRGPSR